MPVSLSSSLPKCLHAHFWRVDVLSLPVASQVRLLLLAALAGEHLLLLGPPGTAKSELSRRMARLTGGTYFERLLTRFSVPEELFGPLSMKGNPYLPLHVLTPLTKLVKANTRTPFWLLVYGPPCKHPHASCCCLYHSFEYVLPSLEAFAVRKPPVMSWCRSGE